MRVPPGVLTSSGWGERIEPVEADVPERGRRAAFGFLGDGIGFRASPGFSSAGSVPSDTDARFDALLLGDS